MGDSSGGVVPSEYLRLVYWGFGRVGCVGEWMVGSWRCVGWVRGGKLVLRWGIGCVEGIVVDLLGLDGMQSLS